MKNICFTLVHFLFLLYIAFCMTNSVQQPYSTISFLNLWWRKLSFSSSPHLAVWISVRESQHRWMPVWCFFHLSNFWLISQLHYANACFRSGTQHTSLCANGLSASLRLRVQLRGDSLISHLAVLFLSCRVILPEVDVLVRNGLYLKEDTHELFWKNRLLLPDWLLS